MLLVTEHTPLKSSMMEKKNLPPQTTLEVDTFIGILELMSIDTEALTFTAWIEVGFMYNCNDFLQILDYYLEDDEKETIQPEDLKIDFDIANAKSRDPRGEAHLIRKGDKPDTIKGSFKNHVRSIPKEELEKSTNKDQYWKVEIYGFVVECSYMTRLEVSPFNELHLILKLMVSHSSDGMDLIRFQPSVKESFLTGFKSSLQGFSPKKGTHPVMMNNCVDLSNKSEESYSRLMVSAIYRRSHWEYVLSHYIIPYLLFGFMVLSPEQDVDILATSTTLVLSNVALLIVTQNNVFSYHEQAVLLQLVLLIVSTVVLVLYGYTIQNRIMFASIDALMFLMLVLTHPLIARSWNIQVHEEITKKLQESGNHSNKK